MRFAGEVRFLRVLRFSGEARRWMKCSMKIMNYSRLTDDGVAISEVEGLGKEGGSVLWRWG